MRVAGLVLLFAVFAKSNQSYEVVFEWRTLNFTWTPEHTYKSFIETQRFIPENVIVTSIKVYKENIYLALPRLKGGVPVTMATIPVETHEKNPPLSPFPDWNSHSIGKCAHFQSVQSFEIDQDGIMWVIDNGRNGTLEAQISYNNWVQSCRPSLFLIDLKSDPVTIIRKVIPKELGNSKTQLRDLVVDRYGGGYAYITDATKDDPSIIVYSRRLDKFWKFKHKTAMTATKNALDITIRNTTIRTAENIHGIALGSQYFNKNYRVVRNVYFSSLSSRYIYKTTSEVLRNETYAFIPYKIRAVLDGHELLSKLGAKQAQSSGMIMDTHGNLYYGLAGLYRVNKWNDNTPTWPGHARKPNGAQEIFLNANNTKDENLAWVDRFSIDVNGNMYLLSNNYHKFYASKIDINEINHRILRSHIGAKSYIYSEDLTFMEPMFAHTKFEGYIYCTDRTHRHPYTKKHRY